MDGPMGATPVPAAVTQCARRPHRKTRTGCKICKARKVKCDEAKPQCMNCIKHSAQCEYSTPQSLPSFENLSSASIEPAEYTRQSTSSDSQLKLDLVDMQLLHHYTTSTYHTLRGDPVQRTMWQITVCEISFENEFVLHEILAIAALHLAHLRPSKRDFYIARGVMHHQIGLRIATNLLLCINEENCTPLCVFAAIAAMFVLASPRTPEDFLLVNEKGLADWMVLMRGMSSIVESSQSVLLSGPLGLMFQSGQRRVTLRSSEPFIFGSVHDTEVQLLQKRILDSSVIPERAEAYIGALSELRKSLHALYAYAETYEASDAFVWVFLTPEAYLVLLKEQDQDALCIFAFFCVILHQLSERWWSQGWSIHLMNQVYRLLDEEHRSWVKWPIEQLGGRKILDDLIG